MDEESLFNTNSNDVSPKVPPINGVNIEKIPSTNSGDTNAFQQNPAPAPNQTNQGTRNVNYNTNYNTNYDKGSKGKGCLIAIIAAVVILGLIIFSIVSAMFSFMNNAVYSTETSYTNIDSDYIEVIHIEGTIYDDRSSGYGYSGYSHGTVLNRLAELEWDSNNKGIILYINSGGGGAYESDELYLALKNYKEQTKRPIYAYYAQTSASGAVYASMAADEIYANRMTMTGSIGVIMSTYNFAGLYEKLGIEEINITSGDNKAMLSSGSEVTDEQTAILQSLIDESYEIFAGIVSEERGIPIEEVYEIADGRLYSPEQALELNLIDGIATYDEFLDYVFSKRGLSDCMMHELVYPSAPAWYNLFYKSDVDNSSAETQLVEDAIEASMQSPLKFE